MGNQEPWETKLPQQLSSSYRAIDVQTDRQTRQLVGTY